MTQTKTRVRVSTITAVIIAVALIGGAVMAGIILDKKVDKNVGPISILDNYKSLSGVRDKLISMKVKDKTTSLNINGYEVLKKLINEKKYNPQGKNAAKKELLDNFFINYDLPQTGSKLFLINIASGLWAETYSGLPWSLKDLKQSEVDGLFIQNDSVNDYNRNASIGRPAVPKMPNTELQSTLYQTNQIVEDAHFKQFNLAMKIAKGSKNKKEATENIILWAEKNFFHAYDYGEAGGSWTWGVYTDGRPIGSSVVSYDNSFPLSIERIYDERIIGCQEPTVFLEGIFHNLNIPAVRLSVWGHGVLYLPTLNMYIHGDSIAGSKWPKGMWLLTPEQMMTIAVDENNFLRPLGKAYDSKYPFALALLRKNKELYMAGPLYVTPPTKCPEVTAKQWKEMTKDFPEYNLSYSAKGTCIVTSKSQPIRTLDQLNDLN